LGFYEGLAAEVVVGPEGGGVGGFLDEEGRLRPRRWLAE
jgi:hypothetical protein